MRPTRGKGRPTWLPEPYTIRKRSNKTYTVVRSDGTPNSQFIRHRRDIKRFSDLKISHNHGSFSSAIDRRISLLLLRRSHLRRAQYASVMHLAVSEIQSIVANYNSEPAVRKMGKQHFGKQCNDSSLLIVYKLC